MVMFYYNDQGVILQERIVYNVGMLNSQLKTKLKQKIMRAMGKALVQYKMIQDGDRIMVCLSGGKDSWTMLEMLRTMQKKAPVEFSLVAVNIDPNFKNYENHKIKEYCDEQGIECHIIKTDIVQIIQKHKLAGKSFCSFCARLKRGVIYTTAAKIKATKIALGHHREDFNETLLLNLFFTGQIKSMSAKLHTDDKKHIVIRPLVYVNEDDIRAYAGGLFPIICCRCPVCKTDDHQRKRMKKLLKDLEKEIPNIKNTLLHSLTRVVPSHLLDEKLYSFE